MTTKLNPFSYWEQMLFQMIELSHPYKLALDPKEDLRLFISERAQEARIYYESLIREGINTEQAKENTKEDVLYTGLKFSPTDYLASFQWRNFNKEIDQQERVRLYSLTKSIFDELNINDSFYEESDKEIELENRLNEYFEINPN